MGTALIKEAITQDESAIFCELQELASRSDVIILHVPLTDNTRHLVDTEFLATIKPGALLINVSRGGIVNTDAVLAAIDSGRLDAVALDVLESEPLVPQELLGHPGNVFTPHVAFSSEASLVELRERACEEVIRVLQGDEPREARNNPLHNSL